MILLAIIISSLITFQNSSHTIKGRILGAQQIEYSQVRIKVYQDDRFLLYTDSDTSGNFKIDNLDSGNYHLFFIDPTLSDSIHYYDTLINVNSSNKFMKIKLTKRIFADSSTSLFFMPYEKDIAKYDIAHHNVKLIRNGLPVEPETICYKKFDSLDAKYGFHTIGFGDVIYPEIQQMTDSYNAPIYDYLNKRNGKDWFEKYLADKDSLKKSINTLSILNLDEFETYLTKKYNLVSGKVYIQATINNKGSLINYVVTKSFSNQLKDILKNEIQKLKFSPFGCIKERTIVFPISLKKI